MEILLIVIILILLDISCKLSRTDKTKRKQPIRRKSEIKWRKRRWRK